MASVPLKYKVFDKYNSSTIKWTLNCRVRVNTINNNIILLNKRKKEREKEKNDSGKSQARESLSVARKSLH